MSLRVEVKVTGETEWCGNGLFFPTRQEAEDYAKALWRAWFLVEEYRVVEAGEPANYHFVGPTNHDVVEVAK